MKWTYVMPAALVLSVVGLATACGSSDKKSSPPTADSFCAKIVAACPSQGTVDECKSGFATLQQACPTETQALLDCGSSATITCGATQQSNTFSGCDDKLTAVLTCVLGGFDAGLGGAGGMTSGGGAGGSTAGASSGGAGG